MSAYYERVFPGAQIVLCDDGDVDFNRGRAIQQGINSVLYETLIFADADYICPRQQLLDSVELSRTRAFVVPYDQVFYLSEQGSQTYVDTKRFPGLRQVDHVHPQPGRHCWGGVNVIQRSTYEKLGGFDPRFRGWGFEDAAFGYAARTLAGAVECMRGRAYHLWHPSAVFPETPLFKASLALCRRYEAADGNPEEMQRLIDERH